MEFSFDTNEGKTMAMNDDETKLLDEISFAPPERRSAPLKPRQSRPSPFAKRAPGPVEHQVAPDDGLDMFMNPGKRTAPPPPMAEEFDGGEEDDGFEEGGQEGGPEGYQGGGNSGPSEGYKTIEDEKADLLNKISRLNKKGIQSSQRLTIYSDIEEIRTEYKRMTYGVEVERSIKFQRRMLIACVTGLEFLNDKFDPFDLALNGWSQNAMENVEDYDGVFEDLHNKYKTKIQMARGQAHHDGRRVRDDVPPDQLDVQGGRAEHDPGDAAEPRTPAEHDGCRHAEPGGWICPSLRLSVSSRSARHEGPRNGLWVPDEHDGTSSGNSDATWTIGRDRIGV